MSVINQVALNDNKIKHVPLYAWQAFRWVKTLSIAKNQLPSLDDGARLLSAVDVLDASENPITTVSEVRPCGPCANVPSAPTSRGFGVGTANTGANGLEQLEGSQLVQVRDREAT